MMERRSALPSLVHTIVDAKLINNVRTAIPGYVLAFNPANQLATLQIGVQRVQVGGKTYTPPPIVNCPVCVYGAAGGALEVQISKGDECLIMFSMRCIDGWRQQGGVAPLVHKQIFREADAFAILAPRSSANVIASYSNEGIKLRSKDGTRYIWLRNDGSIEVKSTADIDVNGATITTDGNVITAAGTDLDAFKAAYDAHTHPGDSGGNTGAPN